jgi:hypothetical protein
MACEASIRDAPYDQHGSVCLLSCGRCYFRRPEFVAERFGHGPMSDAAGMDIEAKMRVIRQRLSRERI